MSGSDTPVKSFSGHYGRLQTSPLGESVEDDSLPLVSFSRLNQVDNPSSSDSMTGNGKKDQIQLTDNLNEKHRKVSFSGHPPDESTDAADKDKAMDIPEAIMRDEGKETEQFGRELLHKYSRAGRFDELKFLLDRPHSRFRRVIDRLDSESLSALHYAARYNNLECVQILVERGANVNIQNDERATPLHLAARYRRKRHVAKDGKTQPPPAPKIAPEAKDSIGSLLRATNTFPLLSAKAAPTSQSEESQKEHAVTDAVMEAMCNQLNKHETMKKAWGIAAKNARRLIEEEQLPSKDNSVILFLTAHGAKVNHQDFYGCTALHYAAMRGNEIACQHLLMIPFIDIEIKDNEMMTPMHTACYHAHSEIVKMLISKNCDLSCAEETGCLPIHLAAMEGNIEIVTQILDTADKRFGNKAMVEMLNRADRDYNTSLHSAVNNGHVDLAKLCIERGAHVNQVTIQQETALHMASHFGSLELVELLLNHGAIVDKYDLYQQTALHRAASQNKCNVIEFLLEKGADPEVRDVDSQTPLILASINGHLEAIAVFIKIGANVLATEKLNKSAVYWAASENHPKAVALLLDTPEKTTLIDLPDRDNNAPLHVAAEKGHLEVVKTLIANEADIDGKNEEEQTPMHLAAKNGKTPVVRHFCSVDRNLCNDEDEDSNMPLHLAAMGGHAKVIQVLLDSGAEIEATNSNKWTALDCAAAKGSFKAAQILLQYDSPVDPKDKSKVTPLYLACRNGHPDLVQLLLSWNADPTIRVGAEDDDPTSGFNCLDVSIDRGHKACVRALIKNSRWKESMRNQTKLPGGRIDTPMRKLIRKMPEVAEEVFDKCTEDDGNHPDHMDYTVKFNYEFLDDTYAHWTMDECDKNVDKDKGDNSSMSELSMSTGIEWIYDENEVVLPGTEPYSHDSQILKKNHPLMIMATCDREALLSHPLVISLLQHKWNTFGRSLYYVNLGLYALFLIFFTIYVMTTQPPFYYEKLNETISANESMCPQVVAFFKETKQHLAANICKYGVYILATMAICKEGSQIVVSKWNYFSFENLIEWAIYILSFVSVLDLNQCQRDTGVRERWQWQTAAVGIFLAWLNLVLFLRKVPRFGIFVVMFTDILKTFLRFFLVFFLFVLAFSFGFFTLLSNQIAFYNIGVSILKTTVMMIGEFDYGDIFYNQHTEPNDNQSLVHYDAVTYCLFSVFVVLMSIITMNLLVGLAVDDIKAVQESAALKRLGMQVEMALSVENLLPHPVRRRFVVRIMSFKPNAPSSLMKKIFKLGGVSGIDHALLTSLQDEQDEKDKMLDGQERIEGQLMLMKQRIKNLREQNERMSKMMEAILCKLDIKYDEDDVDDDELELLNTILPE